MKHIKTVLLKQGVTISNDGATIMKLLDIVHPAAKSLVDVSLAQDAEVVIIDAGCLTLRYRTFQGCAVVYARFWAAGRSAVQGHL